MKPIYCNCGSYLGDREGFDVIRCNNCGIDYVVNPKEFKDALLSEKFSINVTSKEEFDMVVKFLESLTGEQHERYVCGYTMIYILALKNKDGVCLSICDKQWKYASIIYEELHDVKVIPYQSIKSLIEKELSE